MTRRASLFRALLLSPLVWLIAAGAARAQVSMADSAIQFFTVGVTYAGYAPQADFADRYGYTSFAGGEASVQFPSGLYVSAGAFYVFTDQTRESGIFDELGFSRSWSLPETGETLLAGGWINDNGLLHSPRSSMRGYAIPLRIGKVFPALKIFTKANPNCGVFVEAGAQYIRHKLQIDASRLAPYLNGAYERGYDRLTDGFGFTTAVGYRFFSNSRYLNFYLAAEFSRHFTYNRRFAFDQRQHDDSVRDDSLLGFRFGWMFPIYQQAPKEKYYYY